MNAAVSLRARSLVRTHWRATVVLGVFVGLAGGVAVGTWGIARRTSTVYDRFVEYEDAATLTLLGCQEGVQDEVIYEQGYQAACGGYDYADVRELLEGSALVEAAGRFTLAIGRVAPAGHPEAGWRQLMPVAIDEAALQALGSAIVVDGRLADPEVATEVTINEEAASRLDVVVGDQVIVTPYRVVEFAEAGEGVDPPGGTTTTATVVGITRRPSDLVGRLLGKSIYEDTSSVQLGPAWWRHVDADAAAYGIGVAVKVVPGADSEDIRRLILDRWPDRPWFVEVGTLFGQDSQATVRDAIRLQAIGLYVIAGVLALAALVFAGQAVARQARAEWSDGTVLDSLGMTTSDMARSQGWRSGSIALVATWVGASTAIALSPFGPVGVGRAAEPEPGIVVDGVVLAVGLPAIAIAVVALSVLPVIRMRRTAGSTSAGGAKRPLSLPPAGVAGWAMTTGRRSGRLTLGFAIAGVAVAVAVGVATWLLVASYDNLRADPAGFGSAWDAQVGNVGSLEQQDSTRRRIESVPGIDAVGIRTAVGTSEDPQFTILSGEPYLGDVEFGTIVDGRGPARPEEAALGSVSMQRFGVEIGDEVTLSDPSDPTNAATFTVVGRAVINDTLTARPGVGALITDEAFQALSPETLSSTYVVWVRPGVDRRATLDALRQEFPTTYLEQSVPSQVRNLGLVSNQPVLLAVIVALLAGAALVHALGMSVLGNSQQFGVLKAIGFTRPQVLASVAWHASLLTLSALLVGIPLGVVGGRLAWRAIVELLGVASAPTLPVVAAVAAGVLTLVLANLAGLLAGWTAARTRPAAALRTE